MKPRFARGLSNSNEIVIQKVNLLSFNFTEAELFETV